MNKTFFLFLIFICSCGTVNKKVSFVPYDLNSKIDKESVIKNSEIKFDEFQKFASATPKTRYIESIDQYRPIELALKPIVIFPYAFKERAFLLDIRYYAYDIWIFMNKFHLICNGSEVIKTFDTLSVDRDAISGGYVSEHHVLSITRSDVKVLSECRGGKIRVYGTKGFRDFDVHPLIPIYMKEALLIYDGFSLNDLRKNRE